MFLRFYYTELLYTYMLLYMIILNGFSFSLWNFIENYYGIENNILFSMI